MYWEAVIPLTLALGVWAVTSGQDRATQGRPAPAWRWAAAAAAVVLTQAVVLTASRAAWWAVAGLLAVLLVAGVRLFRPLRWPVIVVGLALMVFTVSGWGGRGLFGAAAAASDEATWLSAGFTDPPTALTMPAGTVTTVPITVRNTGLRDWPDLGDNPVHLSYHWVAPDGEEILVWDGARTRLPGAVAAGETVTLPAVIDGRVPPGRYRLQWDLVQEQISWSSTLGAETATTWVEVEHRDDAPVIAELPPQITPIYRERPSRRTLWAAAVRLWAERPLFGIGPDQFRHQVGAISISRRPAIDAREQSVRRDPRRARSRRSPRSPGVAPRLSHGRSPMDGVRSTGQPRGSSVSAWRWECLPMRHTAPLIIF